MEIMLDYKDFMDANDKAVCSMAANYDKSSNKGYYISFGAPYNPIIIRFGHGEYAKTKCAKVFYALRNFCSLCLKKSQGNEELFWDMVIASGEFYLDWISVDDNGLLSTTWENLDKLDSFINKYISVAC